MTFTALMFIVTLLAGLATCVVAAVEQKAGIISVAFCALFSVMFAFLLGGAAYKLAWRALDSKRLNSAMGLTLYLIVPVAFLLAVIVGTRLLVELVNR